MTKIESLEKDIVLLEDCVKGIEAEITALKSHKNPDHSLIARKVKDLTGARRLLDKKVDELEMEKLRDQNQPSDLEKKKIQALFDKKSNSYSGVRNSYVKPTDN